MEEVLREWLHDCATLINQSEFADVSGDALPLTLAMRAAARASDERERRGCQGDDQPEVARAYTTRHDESSVEVQLAVA